MWPESDIYRLKPTPSSLQTQGVRKPRNDKFGLSKIKKGAVMLGNVAVLKRLTPNRLCTSKSSTGKIDSVPSKCFVSDEKSVNKFVSDETNFMQLFSLQESKHNVSNATMRLPTANLYEQDRTVGIGFNAPQSNITVANSTDLRERDSPPTPPPRFDVQRSLPPPLPPRLAVDTTSPPMPLWNDISSQRQYYELNHDTNFSNVSRSLFTSVLFNGDNSPHSPSSGYYSCTPSVASSSPPLLAFANPDTVECGSKKSPLIVQSIKSVQVPKPKPQTAFAPPLLDRIQPPPSYHSVCPFQRPYSLADSNECAVPTTDPPSYVSSIQSYVTVESRPEMIPCVMSTDSEQSCSMDSSQSFTVEHHSPVPKRKDHDRREYSIRNYSPQAFKFFMEQHVENVLKSHRQRIGRRMQLETQMLKLGLNEQTQDEIRKLLHKKESNYIRLKRSKLDKSMFEKIRLIGVGAFGEVTLVRKIDTNQLYAMKTLRKTDVLRKNQVAHVKAERDILAEADNEWVVKLYYSFQDVNNLYFVMEYIPGGDLMSLLIKKGVFEENLAKFYLAELTCAVESVHIMGFIHRDIKPDNILIDRDGHIKLTDFGLCTGFRWTHNAKYYENGSHNRENSFDLAGCGSNCDLPKMKPLERRRSRQHRRCQAHSLVGTPNYIAPEVLCRAGYTQLCDWWSVGVVLYEMLIGSPPFSADSPVETQYKIINWRETLKIPSNANISPEANDIILKLCTSADRRLGKTADEIKTHPFLHGVDFRDDIRGKLKPPYVPKILYATDTSNFDVDLSEDGDSCRNFDDSSSTTTTTSFCSETDSTDGSNKPFHGFFEFTFRRFFDEDFWGGKCARPLKTTPETATIEIIDEESDAHIPIYV